MPEAKLFLLPVPDVDRDRYRHDVIHLIATEDLSVLNLLDNDDPAAACEVVRDQLPGYRPQVLVEGGHATGLDCEVTSAPPLWAKRLRAEFAISEGREPSLAALPNTLERDRFFEGLGALLLQWDALLALGRAFEVSASGALKDEAFDCAMAVALDADRKGLAVRLEAASAPLRRLRIRLEDAPAGLVRSLAMAFQLPYVPVLEFDGAPLSPTELMALSAAFGALAALPLDPSGAGLELSNAAMHVTAQARLVPPS
jgi:hypothetical protein